MSMRNNQAPLVLVGDDDRGCRNALSRLFRSNGFRVETAASLRELQEKWKDKRPLVVVLEYAFPDGRCAPVLQGLREAFPFTAIILLTGTADVEAAAEVLSEGLADRFLTKPWEDAWLVDAVESLIREKGLTRRNMELVQELQASNARLERMVERRTAQLERAKREWEMTFDAIDEPLFIVDSGGMRVQRCNLAMAALAGGPVQEIPGKHCYTVLHGRDRTCETCPVVQGLAGARSVMDIRGRHFDAVFFKVQAGAEAGRETYVIHLREKDA